jgi:hypothetical protein
MAQVLTLKLSDDIQQELQERADKFSISLESFVLKLVLQGLNSDYADLDNRLGDTNLEEIDPILPLIGTLTADVKDVGENHDMYIGRSLYQEIGLV